MDDFAQAISSAINVMAADCKFNALTNITVWQTNEEGDPISPPDLIGDNLCPSQCNGNGKCEKGLCICDDGFAGVDCIPGEF